MVSFDRMYVVDIIIGSYETLDKAFEATKNNVIAFLSTDAMNWLKKVV
jgi:hypothetical protein